MESQILIEENAEKYYGKYVAFFDKQIVAYGKNSLKVFCSAKKKGYEEPIILYVPKPDIGFCFSNFKNGGFHAVY